MSGKREGREPTQSPSRALNDGRPQAEAKLLGAGEISVLSQPFFVPHFMMETVPPLQSEALTLRLELRDECGRLAARLLVRCEYELNTARQ